MFLVCLIYDLNNNISCENKKGDLCACMHLFVFVSIYVYGCSYVIALKVDDNIIFRSEARNNDCSNGVKIFNITINYEFI